MLCFGLTEPARHQTLKAAADLRTRSRIVEGCQSVRDRETIDSELRLLAAIRRVCRGHGGMLPSDSMPVVLGKLPLGALRRDVRVVNS